MDKDQGSKVSHHGPGRYEICIQGHLEVSWMERFGGFSLRHDAGGVTTLSGSVVDQAALHGLLRTVRDLGLPLLAVRRLTFTSVIGPETGTDTVCPLGKETPA